MKDPEDLCALICLYPPVSTAPMPSKDLPEVCIKDYMEARAILNSSPRGAAALLRLVTQKLFISMGLPGKNINDDIGELVSRGLPVKLQQMLDIVRVVGNNAVHPGQLDLEDSPEMAEVLFSIINKIVTEMITNPKELNELYATLPADNLTSIAKRDSKSN